MSATCPNGHTSSTDDYCDTCGAAIDAPASPGPAAASPSLECANCGRAHDADELFCEVCGLDFTTGKLPEAPAPPAPAAAAASAPAPASASGSTGWVVVVEADRAFFDRNQAESPTAQLTFPDGRPATEVPLRVDEVLVGRRSESGGVYPELDLTGALDDPGVSRRHALLRRTGDGWELVDQGSTNGTRVNGADAAVTPGQAVEVADGDLVHLGAWTRLTLRRAAP